MHTDLSMCFALFFRSRIETNVTSVYSVTTTSTQFYKVFMSSLERAMFTNYQCLFCYLKKSFYKEQQNFTMVTKYNLFTVNKWMFATLKSILNNKIAE